MQHPTENRRVQPFAPLQLRLAPGKAVVDCQVTLPRRQKRFAHPDAEADVADHIKPQASRRTCSPDGEPQRRVLPVKRNSFFYRLRRAYCLLFACLLHRAQPEFLIVPPGVSLFPQLRQGRALHHSPFCLHRRVLHLPVEGYQPGQRQHKPQQHQQPEIIIHRARKLFSEQRFQQKQQQCQQAAARRQRKQNTHGLIPPP